MLGPSIRVVRRASTAACVRRSRRFAQGARALSRIPPLFFIFAPQPVLLTVSSLRSVFPPRGPCASAVAASESPATRCRCRLSQAEESPATCCYCHRLSRGRPCRHRSPAARVVPFRRSAAACLLSQQITPPPHLLRSPSSTPPAVGLLHLQHTPQSRLLPHPRPRVGLPRAHILRPFDPSSPLRLSIFGNRTEMPSSPNLPPTPTRLLASPCPSAPPPSPTSRAPAGPTSSRTSATRR
jgi:hypothetical protein